MSLSASARAKRGLIIGIDAYTELSLRYQLKGCVNDARLIHSILTEQFGFPPDHLTLLLDEDAKRDRILAAFDQLVEDTQPDDMVVFHYSGHGSQMRDREGDEPDGWDETIMPSDSGRGDKENRDITDDEIYLRLLKLGEKTSHITLIFDCCHSGSVTRDAFGGLSRSVEADERSIDELPPSPLGADDTQLTRAGTRDAGPSGWLPIGQKYVVLAGCRDEESSYEYRAKDGGQVVQHGSLTYHLSRELRQARSGTTYRDVFERVAPQVTAANSKQHPQIEGMLDRELFGIKEIHPVAFVRVTHREGDKITLAGGAAHGITVGSQWSIHAAGTKSRADEGSRLGLAKVTSVRGVESEASLVEEGEPGSIDTAARAFEESHAFGNLLLRVQIVSEGGDSAPITALTAEIDQSDLLTLTDDEESADIRAYLLSPRGEAGESDAVPQLGALASPTWAVVAEDGELNMPPKSPGEEPLICENLNKLARYRTSLSLDNPSPSSALRGKITLDLLRQRADGEWIEAQPEKAGGHVVFEEQERMAFRISNQHDAGVYVYPFDFGLTGAVSRIKILGNEEILAPGASVDLGIRDGQEIILSIPSEYPFAGAEDGEGMHEGMETLKIFVTSEPSDFTFLEQEKVRAIEPSAADEFDDESASPLGLLLRTAYGGPTTRDMQVTVKVDEQDWTTVAKPFLLRRRTAASLTPDGTPTSIGGVVVTSSGVAGELSTHAWGSARAEAAAMPQSSLLAALSDSSMETRRSFEIAGSGGIGPATRSVGMDDPSITLDVSDPGEEMGHLLMSTDEDGVVSWHFAEPVDDEPATRGAPGARGAMRRFVIPGEAPQALPEPATRGLVGAVGKKLLNELVFPLMEPAIGMVGDYFAGKWEAKKTPYRIRTFTPEDYTKLEAAEIDGELWNQLSSGRALLMLHGTFSRAHNAFGSLSRETVEQLHGLYGGRVFAFDHFTLSESPRKNIEWFLDRLPGEIELDLDIIGHSRGGLVSRVLAEKTGDLALGSKKISVGKVVFAGSPNAGTALADAKHMGAFIDSYTNLLNFFDLLPDNGVTEVLETILTVAKQLAVGTLKGLEGLQSMSPGGPYQQWMNTSSNGGNGAGGARYFALASEFEPSESGLKQFVMNRLSDRIFTGQNDLVVPSASVYDENGASGFPIEKRHVFDEGAGVAHCGYFADPKARETILNWLTD